MLHYCKHLWPRESVSVVYDETWDLQTKVDYLRALYLKAIEDIKNLQQIIINVDSTISDSIKNEITFYLDSQISELEKKFNKLLQSYQIDLNNRITDVDNRLTTNLSHAYIDLNKKINLLNTLFMQMSSELKELFDLVKAFEGAYNVKFSRLKDELITYIDSIIKDKINIWAINPITGELDNLNDILKDIMNLCYYGWLTVEEYAKCQLTVQEYANLNLTVFEYQVYMRAIIHDRLYNRMLSPFTGQWDFTPNVIYRLADLHKAMSDGAITAKELQDLQISASELAGKQITAYNMSWHAKAYLKEDENA